MSDVVVVTEKQASGGGGAPSSIQCPMLNSSNYTVWAMRMRSTLKVHEVWDTIATNESNEKKNDMASALMF